MKNQRISARIPKTPFDLPAWRYELAGLLLSGHTNYRHENGILKNSRLKRNASQEDSDRIEIAAGIRSFPKDWTPPRRHRFRFVPTTAFRSTSIPMDFSPSVRKSELVSPRSGVSNSESAAIISAFICNSLLRDPQAAQATYPFTVARRTNIC